MRTFAVGFLDALRRGSATFWRVQRQDGQTFGWVEHPLDILFASVTYRATQGFGSSSTQQTDTFTTPTVDVSAFLDVTTEAEILAGIWNSATVTVFEGAWAAMPATFDVTRLNILRYGTIGKISLRDGTFHAEIRGLIAALETTRIGRQSTPLCPWTLGDEVCLANGLNLAPFTHSGTVTSLGSNPRLQFTASALTQASGYFTLGTVQFTSGPNNGLPKMDVRSFVNGRLTMQRPLPYAVAVGNTFTAVRGDDKTFTTCKNVFNNVRQHAGWIHLGGIKDLFANPIEWKTRPPEPEAAPDNNPENRRPPAADGGGVADNQSGGWQGEGGTE